MAVALFVLPDHGDPLAASRATYQAGPARLEPAVSDR